jgi:hypothetical protein
MLHAPCSGLVGKHDSSAHTQGVFYLVLFYIKEQAIISSALLISLGAAGKKHSGKKKLICYFFVSGLFVQLRFYYTWLHKINIIK